MAHASAVYVLFASFKMSIDHDIKRIVNVNYRWGEKMILFFDFTFDNKRRLKISYFRCDFHASNPSQTEG